LFKKLFKKKMIYIAGANEHISGANIKQSFMEVGFNTGNMAIARGVTDLVKSNLSLDYKTFEPGIEVKNSDVLVIGAANWISKSVDLSWLMIPEIYRFDKVLVLGLGVQNIVGNFSELSQTAKNFLEFLIQKDAVICTRDKITESFLKPHLKKDFWTGCPSLRINVPKIVAEKKSNSIAYGGSLEVIGHAKNSPLLSKFESSILEGLATSSIDSYILQAEFPIMEALSEKKYDQITAFISSRFGIDPSRVNVNKFKYFFSIDEWIETLWSSEYFIGTRLHGNILAWKAGAKPFLISHDVRTHAFLEDFKFPGYELTEEKTIDQVLEDSKKFNFEQFEEILHFTEKNLQNAFLAI